MGSWGYGPDESDSFLDMYARVLKPLEEIIEHEGEHKYPVEVIEAAFLYNEICKNPVLYYKPEQDKLRMVREKLVAMVVSDAFRIAHRPIKVKMAGKEETPEEQAERFKHEKKKCEAATQAINETARKLIADIDETLKKSERYTTVLKKKRGAAEKKDTYDETHRVEVTFSGKVMGFALKDEDDLAAEARMLLEAEQRVNVKGDLRAHFAL